MELKPIVTVNFHDPEDPGHIDTRLFMREDQTIQAEVRSAYLVSAGQMMRLCVSAQRMELPPPGSSLIDARHLVYLHAHVATAHTHDYRWLPSDRPLSAILEDVVQHGAENPHHGSNCACLDKYVVEVRRHISKAIPHYSSEETPSSVDWEKTMDARLRIMHVLENARRNI